MGDGRGTRQASRRQLSKGGRRRSSALPLNDPLDQEQKEQEKGLGKGFQISYPMTYHDPPMFSVANVSLERWRRRWGRRRRRRAQRQERSIRSGPRELRLAPVLTPPIKSLRTARSKQRRPALLLGLGSHHHQPSGSHTLDTAVHKSDLLTDLAVVLAPGQARGMQGQGREARRLG